jgi:hypothetical protein
MEAPSRCPVCQQPLPLGAQVCPACGTPLPPRGHSPADPGRAGERKGLSPEVEGRVQRLNRWRDSARGLRVQVPMLPGWVGGLASGDREEERFDEMLRGLERTAHHEIAQALEAWGREAAGRLNRLEAYGLPSPTERKSLETIDRALRTGDLDRALELYPRVDQVLGFKERNLNDAREALEGLNLLSADVEVLGLPPIWADAGLLARMERNLRTGRVPETLKQASDLRREAHEALLKVLPRRIREAADETAREKAQGRDVQMEAALLARAARAAYRGRAEQALRDLVRFQTQRSLDPFRMAEARARGDGAAPPP